MTEIILVQGHPDPQGNHLCHAMADAYASGAHDGGHSLEIIDVAQLTFPLIRSEDDFVNTAPPPDIVAAQGAIRDARHLVFVYPLWLGTMPALLKAFLEQVFRYDFAFEPRGEGRFRKGLKGRSARIVVTMGMPVVAYRRFFGAHSLKSFERNILKFSGIKPVRESLYGMVDEAGDNKRRKWLEELRAHGLEGR